MRHALRDLIRAAIPLLVAATTAGAGESGTWQVTAPKGDYAQAILEFDQPVAWTYVGPLRDGRLRVDHGVGVTREGGWLELKGGKLTGTCQRVAGPMGSKVKSPIMTITVDATVSNGVIAGTCTVGGKSGTVKGRYQTEAELAAINPIPKDKNWPAFTGPIGGGAIAEQTGVALVDSLDQARLVWRCEEPVGNNMGSINRFMQRWASASTMRSSGQSSSPMLSEGRVFLHQRLPAGADMSLKAAKGSSSMDMAEVKAAGFDTVPWFAMEKLLSQSDEVVVAMDAATGKTLWRAVLPLSAPNIQYHKDRGGDRTPTVIGSTLVCLGYTGGLYAFDVATGKPLWQAKVGTGKNPALVPTKSVVVAPSPSGSWVAYDAATGAQRWQLTGTAVSGTLVTWRHENHDYVMATTVAAKDGPVTLAAVDADTGTALWTMPLPLAPYPEAYFPVGMTVWQDRLIVYEWAGSPVAAKTPAAPAPAAGGKSKGGEGKGDGDDDADAGMDGPRQVTAYRLSSKGAEKMWSVPLRTARDAQPLVIRGRWVVATVDGSYSTTEPHHVIDLETGKVASTLTGTGPGNGGYAEGMEDMVLVRRDGTHGVIDFTGYRIDDAGKMTMVSPERWVPPIGGSSTSYHHPLMYPVVAGRIFVRQLDGIYCWDLRKR